MKALLSFLKPLNFPNPLNVDLFELITKFFILLFFLVMDFWLTD